ncbi:MAG: FkbM family methyltransferase [Parvibaculales bacterium]
MENPTSLKNQIKFFRPRRFVMGRLRRNPVINKIGRWMEKNVEAFNNEDRHMVRNGEYWLMRTLMEGSNRDYVAFDVGANKGEWTICAKGLNSDMQIHAFELVPDTFSQLEMTTTGLANVTLNNEGLSDATGKVEIFLNSSSETAGLFKRTGLAQSQTVTGKVTTGDSYMRRKKLKHIDFLKIDVEGSEKVVLDGFAKTLKAGKVDVVYFEYGEFNIAARTFLEDFYQQLSGYDIGKLMPRWVEFGPYDKRNENFRPAYYVAVRKDRQDLVEKLQG